MQCVQRLQSRLCLVDLCFQNSGIEKGGSSEPSEPPLPTPLQVQPSFKAHASGFQETHWEI